MLNDGEPNGKNQLWIDKPVGNIERCRPDYESMILKLKERLLKTATFRDAALAYFKGRTAREKMAQLIGELVTEANSLDYELGLLIERQEKDGE